ncbi:MAG: NAD(P)-dependent oxidoreductase [Pseudomonadota bacterium]
MIDGVRVGLFGTGFIAREAFRMLAQRSDMTVVKALTRRPLDSIGWLDPARATHSVDEVIEAADIIFDATGDPIHSTVAVEAALRAGRKVVTMNSELHVTTGSYLAGLGYLTEADGDQPGATALLEREARELGFTPLAFVNVKGFLNPDPTRAEMEYWSVRQQLSLAETTSFTDGTKLQIEQAFTANALGATLARPGMVGPKAETIHDTDMLVEAARRAGGPISDYVLCPGAPPGVFILADHPVAGLNMKYGPYEKLLTTGRNAFVLLRPYHLCGLEIPKSLRAVADGAPPLMTNGPVPRASIRAIAKRDLAVGEHIAHPIGGFDLRGEAINAIDQPDHVPLGLLYGARFRRAVPTGDPITFDDVELPESRALDIWLNDLRPLIEEPALKVGSG